MDAIPDLAKKTSINSLLNPEASTATSTSTGGGVVPYAPYGVGGPGVDVYGPYVAGSTFGLRAASWGGGGGHGHDDRRKEQARYETADVYGRGREDGYTGMWAGGGPEYGHGAMYSDERTPLVSSQTADGIADSPYARMADNYGYSEQWQLSERASARLVARDSRYASPYYQQPYSPPVQPQPQPQPPTPRVVKRRSPAQDPDQPKQKRAKSASAKTPGPSKRGYPAKKRNDAHIAAQSAKPVTQIPFTSEKGKEKADGAVSMRIVPLGPNDPGQALHAEPQSTRCMSTKYKNDPFPRCVACTRRWAGDTCRFQGIRYFLRDATMQIVGVSFSETQKADTPSMKFPKKWNQVLTKAHIDRTKKTIARALLPTLRQELAHLRQDKIIHRPREREVRATCDTCMTSLFSSSWLCRLCGREACGDCYSTIHELTYERPGMTSAETQELARRRETHGYANPFFLQCTKRVDHKAADFSPMSRFCREELERAIEEMEGVVREMEKEEEKQRQNAYGYPAPAPASPTLPTPLAIAPFLPTTLSPLTLSIPTHPIPHYAPASLTPSTFPALWSLGSPLVVVGLLPRFKIAWTPDYFVERYGAQNCLVIECRTEANKRVTVGEFFRAFGRYEGSPSSTAPTPLPSPSPSSAAGVPSTGTRTRDPSTSTHAMLNRTDSVWKLKDWPPSMDFKKAFPELWEDFGNAVPVPSYVRRDGVLNIASHFPEDGVGPDIGPKMYNAMATTQERGSKGSTRLHMDMADALNIMTYAARAPDGTQGCAAWDLFRAEDSDKIRAFLVGVREGEGAGAGSAGSVGSGAGANAGAGAAKEAPRVDWRTNDPIHGQQFYLDEEMRERLYKTTGVKSFRFYQRPGEAVFIPAGCAHQVANLADCIKVAVDFVSPENVERCERLTREFREQNSRRMWKEDVLQLRTMMWFAWLSCRQQERLAEGVEREREREREGSGDE